MMSPPAHLSCLKASADWREWHHLVYKSQPKRSYHNQIRDTYQYQYCILAVIDSDGMIWYVISKRFSMIFHHPSEHRA
jgi:nucleoside diphosphate kinase